MIETIFSLDEEEVGTTPEEGGEGMGGDEGTPSGEPEGRLADGDEEDSEEGGTE